MKIISILCALLLAFPQHVLTVNHRLDNQRVASDVPISSAVHTGSVHDTKTSRQIPLRLFASLERMARLVDISYCVGTTGINKPFICANRCRDFPTLELVKTWNTGMLMSDSCGYIAVDHGPNKVIVVAFRGTYSITNTVVDLATVPQDYTPYPVPDNGDDGQAREYQCQNCTVHSGFFSSWKNARRFVVPHLKLLREKYPSHKIHLVGHSLGGAVAALAAVELKVGLAWDNILVTTFGEPRVGNQGVADFFNQVFGLNDTAADAPGPEDWIFRRVTHTNDPVPLLPPSQWGYRAHSGEIYISKSELYPDLSDVRACLGANDPTCIAGDEESEIKKNVLAKLVQQAKNGDDEDKNHIHDTYAPNSAEIWVPRNSHKPRAISLGVPMLWELFFAHRDYFWRLGLCVPGGNFGDWDKHHYYLEDRSDEL